MNKRIYLSPPHMSGLELDYVQQAFDSNWIAPLGPHVDAFEYELSRLVGIKYGLALSSGTAAIHLALRYLGVGPGDYVFCSDLTFAASCNPVIYQQATPVFIDSEPGSWNMSPVALEKALQWAKREGKLPKAIIIVDLYGQSADYSRLGPLCQHYGIPIIEDAAEALGASLQGASCGTFGRIGIFSFNGNKIVTTSGGGMVVSKDEQAVSKMRFWATQAREPARHYEHKEVGYNYRMSNICAAIGRGQLAVFEQRVAARKTIRERYAAAFESLPLCMMPVSEGSQPNYWLSVITVDTGCALTSVDIIQALEEGNIEARPVWKPMHLQPVFHDCPFFTHHDSGSVGADLFQRGVCLPSGSSLTQADQERVIQTIFRLLH